jgi:hypothetical protein
MVNIGSGSLAVAPGVKVEIVRTVTAATVVVVVQPRFTG